MSVEKLKYWCHKILPLVYDESLSYYEVLCKMKATINEVITILNQIAETVDSLEDLTAEVVQEYISAHPEIISNAVSTFITENPEVVETAVQTVITANPEWIDSVVAEYLADNLHIPFYNVTDYEIQPDMDVYIYNYLHDLLRWHVVNTGGIVYFPKGKYTLDYTIFIPENTMFLGEGEETEIYYDESDTTIGVGLMNGGSNVTIKNMKVSHKTTGTFTSGAQPGAIGFSDTTVENVYEAKYSHTVHRGAVRNLTAENIVFAGNYAIQTENSASYKIENVTYRNLTCPASCVSVAPWNEINNVVIENVDCDLLRIYDDHKILSRSGVKNLLCTNTRANTLYVSDYYGVDGDGYTFINFEQKSQAKQNNILSATYSAALNGNLKFINCKFYARDAETDGIEIFHGDIQFDRCSFYMYSKILTAMISATAADSYLLNFNECVIGNRAVSPGQTVLLGYGNNNIIRGTNILRRLWGDMDDYVPMMENVSSSTHPNRLIVNNKELIMRIYTTITNGVISTYPTRMSQFPCDFTCIPCVIWNSSDRAGTTISTFLSVDSGNIVIGENGITATNYDRLMIHAQVPVTGTPTVAQIHNLLN